MLPDGFQTRPSDKFVKIFLHLFHFKIRSIVYLDLDRTFIEMSESSKIPISPKEKYGKVSMVVIDGDYGDLDMLKIYLHMNGTDAIALVSFISS